MFTAFVSIFVYVDDILLLVVNPVSRLQTLVNIFETELLNLDMSINPNKSVCIRFGPRFNAHCEYITYYVSGVEFEWVAHCQYLGMYCQWYRQFRCSFDTAKSLFFTLFYFQQGWEIFTGEVVINLSRSK